MNKDLYRNLAELTERMVVVVKSRPIMYCGQGVRGWHKVGFKGWYRVGLGLVLGCLRDLVSRPRIGQQAKNRVSLGLVWSFVGDTE